MQRVTVHNAIETLEELYNALVAAYWDANDVFQKDTVFDILSVINAELAELGKLGIDDLSMSYEPVTSQFPACGRKFKQLQNTIDTWFPRTGTAQNLHHSLAAATSLISPKYV